MIDIVQFESTKDTIEQMIYPINPAQPTNPLSSGRWFKYDSVINDTTLIKKDSKDDSTFVILLNYFTDQELK